MKARTPVLSEHRDLQVKVMDTVAGAIHAAGTEMCLREKHLPSGGARWALAEGVIVSLFAFAVERFGPEKVEALALMLARDAVEAKKKGLVMKIDKEGGS